MICSVVGNQRPSSLIGLLVETVIEMAAENGRRHDRVGSFLLGKLQIQDRNVVHPVVLSGNPGRCQLYWTKEVCEEYGGQKREKAYL